MFIIACLAIAFVPDNNNSDLQCGAYCLYTALQALDVPVGDYPEFEKRLGPPSRSGYSLQQLADGAEAFGASTLGVNTSLDQLSSRKDKFACIAHINENHFVCIYALDDENVYVVDPPTEYSSSRDAFEALWHGKALLISPRPLGPIGSGNGLLIVRAVCVLVLLISSLVMIRHYALRRMRAARA